MKGLLLVLSGLLVSTAVNAGGKPAPSFPIESDSSPKVICISCPGDSISCVIAPKVPHCDAQYSKASPRRSLKGHFNKYLLQNKNRR